MRRLRHLGLRPEHGGPAVVWSTIHVDSPVPWARQRAQPEQIRINGFSVSREHTMRETRIELQGRVLEKFHLQLGRTLVWNV